MRLAMNKGWAYELVPTGNTQILAVDRLISKL
jgi:hypothetical protein